MDITSLLNEIPPSASDQLLHSWGYDLLFEYHTIAQQLPPSNSPVIELATGTGRMCAILSGMFPSIISGDISLTDLPRTVQRIPQQYLSRLQFLQLDMEHLPFHSNRITSLVCMNTMHEVEQPKKCLEEIIRVMSMNGTAVIGDFNRTGFEVMQKIHEQVYHNDHPEGNITTDEIERILKVSFRSVRTIASPLNITYIASDKR
jgi:ubiquinone/menaquinone biosynthesis C-methylase UbiE